MGKYFSDLLKISVTVLGLGIVLGQVELQEIWRILSRARLSWVLVSFFLIILSLIIRAFRWSLLLRGLGVRIRFTRLAELYFIGNFFNTFLPSGFGGDIVRVWEVARDVPSSVAAGTVLLDRLTGLIMLFVMALLSSPWRPAGFPEDFLTFIIVGSLVGIVGGVVMMEGSVLRRLGGWLPSLMSPTGDGPIARLLGAVQQCGWASVSRAMAVSLVFNLILSSWWLVAGLALGQQVDFGYYILLMPFLSIPLLVPSIAGLGPRELVAPAVLSVAGMTAEAAVSLSLLVFVVTRLSGLVGAPIYFWATIRDSQWREKIVKRRSAQAVYGMGPPSSDEVSNQ
jgi:uncharacterized membrane protein YbhN (UPF0104 family)